MTTQTITNTQTAGSARTRRLTKMQVWCQQCTCLQPANAVVGWCVAHAQYRLLRIDRDCGEFRIKED